MAAGPVSKSAKTANEPVRPIEQIVIPVQGTDREFLAQSWAVELAAALELPVHAVHVDTEGTASRRDVFTYLNRQCEKWGVKATTRVIHGADIVQELVDELRPRDLVVLGSRRMAAQYHVGSVAVELVRKAPCPVQIVRIE